MSTVIRLAPEILRTTSSNRKSITVLDVMCWPKRAQRRTAEAILRDLDISPHLEVHDLSASRRKLLAERLDRV